MAAGSGSLGGDGPIIFNYWVGEPDGAGFRLARLRPPTGKYFFIGLTSGSGVETITAAGDVVVSFEEGCSSSEFLYERREDGTYGRPRRLAPRFGAGRISSINATAYFNGHLIFAGRRFRPGCNGGTPFLWSPLTPGSPVSLIKRGRWSHACCESFAGWGSHVFATGSLYRPHLQGDCHQTRLVTGPLRLTKSGRPVLRRARIWKRMDSYSHRVLFNAGSNGRPVIIGRRCDARDGSGVVEDRNGRITPLVAHIRNPAGWSNLEPEVTDGRGEIAGVGRFHHRNRFFLLTPGVQKPST